jgi:hypothetical protein
VHLPQNFNVSIPPKSRQALELTNGSQGKFDYLEYESRVLGVM